MRHTDSMTSNVFCLLAGRFVSLPLVQLMGKLMGATRSIESQIVFFFHSHCPQKPKTCRSKQVY